MRVPFLLLWIPGREPSPLIHVRSVFKMAYILLWNINLESFSFHHHATPPSPMILKKLTPPPTTCPLNFKFAVKNANWLNKFISYCTASTENSVTVVSEHRGNVWKHNWKLFNVKFIPFSIATLNAAADKIGAPPPTEIALRQGSTSISTLWICYYVVLSKNWNMK